MTRAVLRIGFSYKGSVMWRMNAGMGDSIFGPAYQALKKRGVTFRFFHKVTNLGVSDDLKAIDRIEIDLQARLVDGPDYDPFVPVRGIPCWPAHPRWDQLVDGGKLKAEGVNFESAWDHTKVATLTLERGRDFDDVVLGISIAAFHSIARECMAANPRFGDMVERTVTVQTQGVQTWLRPTLPAMGWSHGDVILSGGHEPLDTWAVMTDVLFAEDWHGEEVPQSLHYFCGQLPGPARPPLWDPDYPRRALEQVKHNAHVILDYRVGRFWPDATTKRHPDGVGYPHLFADPAKLPPPGPERHDARFEAQYFRANIDPTERYVLNAPGTLQYRLASDDSGFDNLFLAGDWTRTGLNSGCVEAAVMSGLQASRALCGRPRIIYGESDFPWLEGRTPDWPDPPEPDMPLYAKRIGTYAGPGPLECTGVDCYAFLLDSSTSGALQAMCDRFFNTPSGGDLDIRPLMDNVLYTIMVIDKCQSTDPEGRLIGSLPETDVGFWLPVAKCEDVLGVKMVTQIYLAPLVLFVDQAIGLVSGRETWGFPKELGRFTTPSGSDDQGPWKLATQVTPKPAAPIVEQDLVTVVRTGDPAGGLIGEVVETTAEILKLLVETVLGDAEQRMLPGLALAPALIDDLRNGAVPLLFLKQLRDGVETNGACYQTITWCTTTASWKGLGLMKGEYRVDVKNPYSHPHCEDLGIDLETDVVAAFWCQLDATFGKAEVLWPAEE